MKGKKILSCAMAFLYFCICIQLFPLIAAASQNEVVNFTDDSIIITLSQQASQNTKDYVASDFEKIGVVSVDDLTEYTVAQLKNFQNGLKVDGSELSDFDDFHRILKLNLKEKGKKQVLQAVETALTYTDIISASPNYLLQPFSNSAVLPLFDDYSNDPFSLLENSYPYSIDLRRAWELTTGNQSNGIKSRG